MNGRWQTFLATTFILASSLTQLPSAGVNAWTGIVPYGGTVRALAIDPGNPSILYAGTWGGGIFKSTVMMSSDLGAARAEGPVRTRSVLDITLPQPALSALCGFVVLRHIEGVTDVKLFLDDDGTPVHEIDTSPGLRNTYFSPDTGKAVSYPGTGSAVTNYFPDGTAVVALDGFLTRVQVPGGAPLLIEVGRVVFSAHVVGTSPDGVPLTGGPIELLFDAGVMRGSVIGACEALEP